MNQAGPYFGKVKSYNSKKGYGFIDCPAARAVYGRDVFIHKAQMGELLGRFVGPGTRLDPKCLHMHVRFSVGSNREGMPQARDVIRIHMPDEAGDMMGLGLPPVMADPEVPLFQPPLGNFGGLPLGGYVPQTGGASSSREEPRSYRGRGGTIRLMHGQEAGAQLLDGGCAGQQPADLRFKEKKRGKGTTQGPARYGATMLAGPGGDDNRRRRQQQDRQPQFIGNPMYPQLYGSAQTVQPSPFGVCPGGQADSPTSAAYGGLNCFIAPDQQVSGGNFGQDGCQGAMHMLSQYAAATMNPPYPAYLPQAQFQQEGAETPQSQTGSPTSPTALHLSDQVQSPQQLGLNPLQGQQPLQVPLPGQHPQYLLQYQQALMNPGQMASLLGDEVRGAPGAACQANPLAPALNPALMAPMMYAPQIGLDGTPRSRQSFGFGFAGEDNPRTAPSTPVSPGGRSGGSDDDDVGLRAQPLSPLYLGPTSLPNFMGMPSGWPRMEGTSLEPQVQERVSHSL
mmetsp:Transcript_46447/g.108148  ORF Transcript_46447/g.108148 Transcript_46447/m.108148 type:complete len:508 (-) Transcript_46447:115-1638(-)